MKNAKMGVTDIHREVFDQLSKEELYAIIDVYYHCYVQIGEILVDASKQHMEKEEELEKIREKKKKMGFKFYDDEKLKHQLKVE